MKKLLLLICALLGLGTSGAWATVTATNMPTDGKAYYVSGYYNGTKTYLYYNRTTADLAVSATLDADDSGYTWICETSGDYYCFRNRRSNTYLYSSPGQYTHFSLNNSSCTFDLKQQVTNSDCVTFVSTSKYKLVKPGATGTKETCTNQQTSVGYSSDWTSDFCLDEAPIVPAVNYTVLYSSVYMKSDSKWSKSKLDGDVIKFTLVDGTKDTYYMQETATNKYIYAAGIDNAKSVTTVNSKDAYIYQNTAALGLAASLPDAETDTDGDGKDLLDYQWVLSEKEKSGTFIIRPKSFTSTAISVCSINDSFFSYLDYKDYPGTYSWSYATLRDMYTSMEDICTNPIKPNVDKAGTVGYPKKTSVPTDLGTMLTARNTGTLPYSKAYYDNLRTNYATYLSTADANIVKPEDGKAYTFTNVQFNNNRYDLYDDGGNLVADNTEPTGGTNIFICHVIDATNYAFVSANGHYLVGADSNNKTMTDAYDANLSPCSISKYSFGSVPSTTFGKVKIYFAKRPSGSSNATTLLVNKDKSWNGATSELFQDQYSNMYEITEVDDYYNKVTLTTDNTDAYASLYLPFSVEIPSGITAYKVTSQNGEYAHMESIVTNGILPKETPAILKKAGQTENLTVYLSPATGAGSAVEGNLLKGTVATAEAKPSSGTTYVLGKIGDDIGLYEYTASTLAPGKAYLNTAAGVKALAFDFGDADGIKTMDNGQLKMDNANIFNLAGQRMNKLQRGVNIVNGKKIIVK